MAKIYSGTNPSKMMLEALRDVLLLGDELAPRGKRIKELRPVVIENLDGRVCMTYVDGRTINPFFQIFESAIWINSGRADVDSLVKYNANMKQFSDDGEFFNASYGERSRNYGANSPRGVEGSGIDQMEDCLRKLQADRDTRQAILNLNNPEFDNSEYTLSGGKDISCNLILAFKIRSGKLNLTVFNRSNDIAHGTYGANLYQFSTLLRVMAGWLNVEVGTYTQITDSLHQYLDDYGFDVPKKIIDKHPDLLENLDSVNLHGTPEIYYSDPTVPKLSFEETEEFLGRYWKELYEPLHKSPEDVGMTSGDHFECLLALINNAVEDQFYRDVLLACYAYQLYKRAEYTQSMTVLSLMSESYEKVACLNFVLNSKVVKEVNKNWIETHVLDTLSYEPSKSFLRNKLANLPSA